MNVWLQWTCNLIRSKLIKTSLIQRAEKKYKKTQVSVLYQSINQNKWHFNLQVLLQAPAKAPYKCFLILLEIRIPNMKKTYVINKRLDHSIYRQLVLN